MVNYMYLFNNYYKKKDKYIFTNLSRKIKTSIYASYNLISLKKINYLLPQFYYRSIIHNMTS